MPLSESQLETWSRVGPQGTAQNTYHSIRNALSASTSTSTVRGHNHEVYLQGSYRNDTNIRGDSDVDVVVQLDDVFEWDRSALSQQEELLFRQAYSDAPYTWRQFRSDVLHSLREYYGAQAVREGNKSLKVQDRSNRLAADVVVATQWRRYSRFFGIGQEQYVEGMVFYTRLEGRRIVNYPKLHWQNGAAKNGQWRTNGWLKPTVRIFKNSRTFLVEHGALSEDLAPSHCIESLLYNVPDGQFGGSFQDTYVNILNWLNATDLTHCVFQHEQYYLFGGSPDQWSMRSARQLVSALIDLWNAG